MPPLDGSVLLLTLVAAGLIVLSMIYGEQRRRLGKKAERIAKLEADVESFKMQLSALQQRMIALADATFDALVVVDAQHRVVSINQVARDLFRHKEKTLIGVTRNHELDTLVDSVLRGEPRLETQVEIADRSFRVCCSRLESNGTVEVILVLQDITELLRLARARRDMVANFSHDLRTPISSIRLLVDTLSQNLGRNPARDARLVGRIAGETDSLQHMTQELIDLSMIESGRAIIRMVQVDFAAILRDAFHMMGTQVEQKKLNLVNRIPDELRVLADPEQTRRVIANIMHNAIKFTPSGGKITFSAKCGKQMATIYIKDTGPGIPPQDRARIFERFYQVDAARSENAGGSGLGLSIAKHIIEAQGGKIWAEAAEPHGACICFTIPLADKPQAER
ncbi:MAG: PAS domain-containing protein [Anaerolineae bacterium]|nr:PAS domain-containing protein [Anaerolineae bacterium]